jgi:hypothetical protein
MNLVTEVLTLTPNQGAHLTTNKGSNSTAPITNEDKRFADDMVRLRSTIFHIHTTDYETFVISTQPIFQDQNGLAVKFFLQKDLSQETQAEICEIITVRDLLGIFVCH